jgi:hypothetical protein
LYKSIPTRITFAKLFPELKKMTAAASPHPLIEILVILFSPTVAATFYNLFLLAFPFPVIAIFIS